MTQSKQKNGESSLAELTAQLATLKREVAGIGEDVLQTLESRWIDFHSVLFPHLVDFGSKWGIESSAVFKVQAGHLMIQSPLSMNIQEWPPKISLHYDLATFESFFGENISSLILRSLSSREMEFDFDHHVATVPFCLFDAVVGLGIFKLSQLHESDYERLVNSVEKLFDRMRREILEGRLSELKKNGQRAG